MKVKVEFFATLRQKFGREKTIEIDGSRKSLREVLSAIPGLLEEISEGGKVKHMYKVLVNGINVEFLEGLNTPIKDGDEIAIFPPAGGG